MVQLWKTVLFIRHIGLLVKYIKVINFQGVEESMGIISCSDF